VRFINNICKLIISRVINNICMLGKLVLQSVAMDNSHRGLFYVQRNRVMVYIELKQTRMYGYIMLL